MGVESALILGRLCWAKLLLLECTLLLKVSRQIAPDLLLSTERKAVSYVILRESLAGAFPGEAVRCLLALFFLCLLPVQDKLVSVPVPGGGSEFTQPVRLSSHELLSELGNEVHRFLFLGDKANGLYFQEALCPGASPLECQLTL